MSERAAGPERKRRSWFLAATAAIPVLALVLLEVGLRAAGFGDDFDLLVPVPGRPEYLYPNPELGRLYFSESDAPPSIAADYIPASREDGELLLVVQGESSAAGFPFYYGGTFPHILENRIRRAFPDRQVNVLNAGMAAVSSFAFLDMAPDIIRLRPDAVLIYGGHNEYYGALGTASTERLTGGRFLVRLYLKALRLRTVQLLREVLEGLGSIVPSERGSGGDSRMERLARDRSIGYDSDAYREGLDQLRGNLSRLLDAYGRRRIPVYISTIASNERDQPPFIGAEADSAYREAKRLDGLGQYERARDAYARARDLDRLRFRAPEEANDVIRDVASKYGAILVDAQAKLTSASRDGITGADVMTDHLHPNVRGYHEIADAFFESMTARDFFGAPARENGSSADDVVLTEVDSLVGALHIATLLSGWPFEQAGGRARLAKPTRPVEALAQAVFFGKMSWAEANGRLIEYRLRTRDLDRALRAARSRMQELPFSEDGYLLAARIQLDRGMATDAMSLLRSSIALRETWQAHAMLSVALTNLGNHAESQEHRSRADQLRAGRP